jgi:DNA-binding response OmpR family regulator
MLLSDYKFLIVDQTTFACQLVQDTLYEMGARTVCHATDVSRAMGLVREGNVNFLICEHDLLGASGFELITQLRADIDLEIKRMPIMVLTGTSDKKSILAARDAGTDEIVAKPFTAASLKSHLEAIIKKRRDFIDERAFAGPDRRRLKGHQFEGENRRD